VKVSRKKVAEHRAALVATAGRLLQKRGFEGAGVAEICREAGLTQGALYGQFKSKDALAREATSKAFADRTTRWRELGQATPDPLSAYLDAYLSESQLKDTEATCLLAACVSDVPRQDASIAAAYANCVRDSAALFEDALPKGVSKQVARRRALTLVSAMVGGIALARALQKTDPDLSREIIAATREELKQLARQ
jgi:TetR/AcrR family transcriptional repressor of nem operon